MVIDLTYYEILEAVGDYVNKHYPCEFNLDELIDHAFPINVNIGDDNYAFCELDAIQFTLVT
jgi:hypothetical protein